jgi:hypothetical protein
MDNRVFRNYRIGVSHIEQVILRVEKRKLAYDELVKKFFFFLNLYEISLAKVRQDVEVLLNIYSNYLITSFINECVQF